MVNNYTYVVVDISELNNIDYSQVLQTSESTVNKNISQNGVKYIDQSVPNGWTGYINNFRIGDGYDYSSRRFQGSMPYVAIYNRPLSDDEVINSYNSLKWRFK